MAERFVSPGVFTRENDLSFLPQGIATIGAAFIGPTLKGPAFRPIIVESQEDFEAWFGATSIDFYTPYAVRNYLKESSRATIVRVLGKSGYSPTTVKSARLAVSGSGGEYTLAYLHPSRVGVSIVSGSVVGTPTAFNLMISGSNGSVTFTSMSATPSDPNYFVKALGSGPTTGKDAYVYSSFPNAVNHITANAQIKMYLDTGTTNLNFNGTVYGTYRNALTPWIRSQTISGQKYNLFRFYTLSDGTTANTNVKISITSVRPDPAGTGYGTFGVLVRKAEDTDAKVEVLEQFDNLTLDPTSANYIAKRIGDARTVIENDGDVYLEGDFPNNSKYIYVDMVDGIEDVPYVALPYGFAPMASPVVVASSIPAPDYVTTRYSIPAGATTPVASNKTYYGFNYSSENSLSWLRPVPSGSWDASLNALVKGVYYSGSNEIPLGGTDDGFDLSTISTLSALDGDTTGSANYTLRKFTVPLQGGFDGMNPAVIRNVGSSITSTNTMGFDLSDSSKDGSQAYAQAITALSNADAYDINMLVMPGVIYSQHPYIAQKGIDLCEDRGDAFYIMDPEILGAMVSNVVTSVQSLDTNYVGVYHPWVKIFDEASNKNVWVPPSTVMAGIYAFSDRVSAEWYAPAGLNRGGISVAVGVRARLDNDDRDTLYESRINPIAQFPGQGIVAWGQKTLQQDASALDRINVRRLLIAVKKFIASTSRYLVFEQNVESTRQRFLSVVNPYLASVQERNGLYAFKVKMDESNNTPDIIDRNILVGELYLQPTKTAEFISLTFNVLPTGAVFPE